jgi:iron(III) transport system substrate-binding protein
MKKLMTLALALCATCALAQTAQSQDWQKQWDQWLAAAKKEGKVVILAPPDQAVRKALPAAFEKKYGITVDYIGGRSSESAARIRSERAAGLYSTDLALSGIQTMATIFYREKMLAPLKPMLIRPDVVDGSHWTGGKLWFMDPEQEYILRLFNTRGVLFYINTDQIKPDEIRSSKDLLNPKWKGKIAVHDPTVPGTGSNDAARLYASLGENFAKGLYVDQKPAIARNRRQLTDWLLHGTYPIVFGAEDNSVERARKEGFPVYGVYALSDLAGSLSAGIGELAVFNHTPHPNAARIFANWILSKDGLELFAKARGENPTRTDIDASKFLPADEIPKPGINYFDTYGWEFTVTTKENIRARMKQLVKK